MDDGVLVEIATSEAPLACQIRDRRAAR